MRSRAWGSIVVTPSAQRRWLRWPATSPSSLAFAGEGLLGTRQLLLAAACIPLMIGGTTLGYQFNGRLGDDGYRKWFWVIIGAYGLRLAGVLPS